MPDYKMTELLMHYLTEAMLSSQRRFPVLAEEVKADLETLRNSLMKLEATVARFDEALRKDTVPTVQTSPAPVRYEYKSLWGTHQIGNYAAIGYRLHSITPEDGTLCIVMEREVPSEELEDDIFNLTYKDNGKAE